MTDKKFEELLTDLRLAAIVYGAGGSSPEYLKHVDDASTALVAYVEEMRAEIHMLRRAEKDGAR
jgi:hypothetical protein